MRPICSILNDKCFKDFSSLSEKSVEPKSFEALSQDQGFVLYQAKLPKSFRDPSILDIKRIADRGYVYLNRNLIGILSRENHINSIPITLGMGDNLEILVENQGRLGSQSVIDLKGIDNVSFDRKIVKNWIMHKLPFDRHSPIDKAAKTFNESNVSNSNTERGPVLFYAEFKLSKNDVLDTYINTKGWGKVRLKKNSKFISLISSLPFSGFYFHQWL